MRPNLDYFVSLLSDDSRQVSAIVSRQKSDQIIRKGVHRKKGMKGCGGLFVQADGQKARLSTKVRLD